MIGAGIFTTSGFSLSGMPRVAVLGAWCVAGFIAVCGAATYGMLARRITESGGEYLFLSRTFHPAIGFIAGWVSLLQGFTGALAFAAVTLELYALPESVRPAWYPPGLLAIAAILLFACVHALQLRPGLQTQNAIVVTKLGMLAVFIIWPFVIAPVGQWPGMTEIVEAKPFSIDAFATSLVWISLSYSGFNAAVYVTSEVRHAHANVPRALIIGTLLVTGCYLLLNFIFVFGPPLAEVSGQEHVAAVAAKSLGGVGFEALVRGIICLALVSSISSLVIAGPRVYAKMAEDGVFPKCLAFQGTQTPVGSIFLQAVLACLLVLVTTLQDLLGVLGFTLSVSAALTAACIFFRGKDDLSPGLWGYAAAGIYVLATLSLAVLYVIEASEGAWWGMPKELLAFVGTLASGLLVYWGMTRIQSRQRNRQFPS